MAKKAFEVLSETMFYVLMSFLEKEMCGAEIAQFIEKKTRGRVSIGPGTLYTILAKFEEEHLISECFIEGRKRIYQMTPKGTALYQDEVARLKNCVADAESEDAV